MKRLVGLTPEAPADAGVHDGQSDSSHLEGAHVLADEAAGILRSEGFSDDQILEWAEAYLGANKGGDVAGLVAWMGKREAATQGEVRPTRRIPVGPSGPGLRSRRTDEAWRLHG